MESMELNTLLWIVGAAVVPTISWAIFVTLSLLELKALTTRMVNMQEHPETTGFGIIITDNTKAIKALTHYVKWMAQMQTGQIPPPPLDLDI